LQELEFLVDTGAINSQQYNAIISQLPEGTPLNVPTQRAQEAPSAAMANMNINGHADEKRNDFFANNASTTPVNGNPPPPAYPTAPAAPAALARATALYQYNAQDAGDLPFDPNDMIQVTEYMNAEWWKGRNERTGQEGIFPRSYVKVVEDKGAMQTQPSNYGNMPLDVSQSGSGPGNQPGKGAEMGKKFGKKLGNAAIFGAGATIGSNIVNGIF
jgi:LAS seventeen-binding protein 1/2